MNNDLISREALKAEFVKMFPDNRVMTMLDIIDNAPTVEPFEKIGSICEENCGYRPQGKWIDVPCERDLLFNNGIKYTCSACGKFNSYGHSSFCPNCGADMRKGGAEND